MGWLNINGNWIGRHSGKKAESWSSYWNARKPYFTIDNTGNVEALTDAQIPITLTDADVDIASIETDGSNLFFYTYGDVFIHSYINYLTATTCEVYIKVSCAALSILYVGLKLQTHANTDDFAGVMVRRTAHASTNMLYKCDDVTDSEGNGPNITLNGAAVTATKFGNVIYCDGTNDNFTIAMMATLTDYCGFSFNFVLPDDSWDDGARHDIFVKSWNNNNIIDFYIETTGLPHIYYKMSSKGPVEYVGAKLETGKIHSFTLRFTKNASYIYVDNILLFDAGTAYWYPLRVPTTGGTTSACFFGSHSSGALFTKCYIWDIEYNNISLPIKYQRARSENISLFNRAQAEKETVISQLPSTTGGAYWGEGNIIIEDDLIKVYHQKSYSDADVAAEHNIYVVSISNDLGVTWEAPVTLMGYGTDIENTVGIYFPYTFKDTDGKTYVIYSRHNDNTKLYIRELVNGNTPGDVSVFITNTNGRPYNCSVINDGGVYKGLVDVGVTKDGFYSYVQYYISGNSLTTMSYGTEQATLGVRSTYNYGASMLVKSGGKYICWFGVTPGNNIKALLPCVVSYAESTDPSSNEWTVKSLPVLELDQAFADDQVQDYGIAEYNSKTYFIYGKNNNTSGQMAFVMSFSKYEGTIAQFIKDITVTHSGL